MMGAGQHLFSNTLYLTITLDRILEGGKNQNNWKKKKEREIYKKEKRDGGKEGGKDGEVEREGERERQAGWLLDHSLLKAIYAFAHSLGATDLIRTVRLDYLNHEKQQGELTKKSRLGLLQNTWFGAWS